MSMRIKLKHCSDALKERWLQDAHDLLTTAGVPQWVEVESMPGNSLPHRLQWYLLRRKDVSEGERTGECVELNAMDAEHAPSVVGGNEKSPTDQVPQNPAALAQSSYGK